MPAGKYFKGHGEKVMSSMKEKYGDKKGKQVFYATANARKSNGDNPGNKPTGSFGFGRSKKSPAKGV